MMKNSETNNYCYIHDAAKNRKRAYEKHRNEQQQKYKKLKNAEQNHSARCKLARIAVTYSLIALVFAIRRRFIPMRRIKYKKSSNI